MKLVKQTKRGFQYQLSQEEANSLRHLVNQFPFTGLSPAKVSKTDSNAIEREKLLNESMAGHRRELKRQAGDLVSVDKFKASGSRQLFNINPEERETMLQILNDIRVESWKSLGEPENLEINVVELPKDKIRHYHFMHLSGYFEHHFLNLEE